jgi:outer membrane receptor for ferrienterochelin and colicins
VGSVGVKGWERRLSRRAGFALRVGASAAALAAAIGPASAQSAPAPQPSPAQPSPAPASQTPAQRTPEAAPGQDDIIVTAPPEQSSIDRQTYNVRDTPEARSTTTLDLLGRLPTVEVRPDGSVRLIGAGTATILVDGRRIPDPVNFLRNLQGSQIARIEVMTNPGAQFPAISQGGIINIVTRRSVVRGLGGSLTATGGQPDMVSLRAAPTWGSGPWSLTASIGAIHFSVPEDELRERFLVLPAGLVPISRAIGEDGYRIDAASAYGSAAYKLTDHQTISFTGIVAANRFVQLSHFDDVAAAFPGGSAVEDGRRTQHVSYQDLSLDYRGDREGGELLTASAKLTLVSGRTTQLASLDPAAAPPSNFRQDGSFDNNMLTLKADYERPLGGHRRLSFGGQLIHSDETQDQAQSGEVGFSRIPFANASHVAGSWWEHAGYVTFQFALAGFTILPGVRIEGREYEFTGNFPHHSPETTHLFPSLHMERRLAAWLNMDASYSRRVAYPSIASYDPTLIYLDATTAYAGNPDLRPTLTDSLEAKLHAVFTHHNVDLTLYERITHDVWSTQSVLDPNGVLIFRQANFGTQYLTGGELSARGPLLPRLRYVVTANLAAQRLDARLAGLAGARSSALFTGSAQLEYKDGVDGRPGADRINLTLRYAGPNDSGFSRTTAQATANLTWSHQITARLSSVLNIQDLRLTRPQETIGESGSTLQRTIDRRANPRVTLSLSFSLGRANGQRPQAPPPIPLVGGPGR